MRSWIGFLFQRAVALHPMSWLVMLLVFAGFLWLNFNSSKVTYLEHHGATWHGGLRQGFPIPWWDGGKEASCVVTDDGPSLNAVPYGGWQPGGIVVGLLVLAAALTGAAAGSELLVKRLGGSRLKAVTESWPLQRRLRIRLVTGLVTLIVVATVVALNLVATVSVSAPDSEPGSRSVAFSERMGWPFPTYTAGEPVLINADREVGYVMTAKEADDYLKTHEPVWWRRSHWSAAGIVLNSVSALVLILGTALTCEWLSRRTSAPK